MRAKAWIAIASLLQLAESYYLRGAQGYGHISPRARFGIIIAAKVYRKIGLTILANGPTRYYQQRAVVGRLGKAYAVAQASGVFLQTLARR